MSKCAAHQGRGRAPKDCQECAAGKLTFIPTSVRPKRNKAGGISPTVSMKVKTGHYAPPDAVPNVTPDGMTFLDPNGNEPQVDASGCLVAPFVLQFVPGRRENWAAKTILPLTPMAYAKWAAAIAEARGKIHKPKVKE